MSNGRLCMETIKGFIDNTQYDASVEEFCRGVTKAIQEIYTEHGFDIERLKTTPIERTTASAVIYSSHRRQVWLVGDCHCIVNGIYYSNPKPDEEIIAAKRSAFIKKELSLYKNKDDLSKRIDALRTCDTGRNHIIPDLIASCSHQNKDYAVIDGFEIPVDKVRIIDIASSDTEIILASDGYPFIRETLQQSEDCLREIISADPLLIDKYKATKGVMKGYLSFDDRSYIRFRD